MRSPQAPTEADLAKARRWYRRWLLGFAALALVTSIGSAISYVQARALLTGDTLPAVGTVIKEEKGFLGVRNLVTVEYTIGRGERRAVIPVKGDGFRGLRIDPYFYDGGDQIQLLVDPDDLASVRTAERWTPAVYNWSVVAVFCIVMLGVVLLIRRFVLRAIREKVVPGVTLD